MSQLAVLALESGGTKLVASVADERGDILDVVREPRGAGNRAADTVRQLIGMGERLRSRQKEKGYRCDAIGFGYGGLVRRASNHPYLCLHEDGWEEISATEMLQEAFSLPVFVENDCKVAALAESLRGAGRGASSMFYVTVGTGVGGGLVRDGVIAAQNDGGESEIGHLHAMPGGPPCGCGGFGCVEAICSGPGILQLGGGRFPNTKSIFDAWAANDAFATEIIYLAAGHLARALAATMALLHPARMVMGGGVATGNPEFVRVIERLTRPLVVSYFRQSFDLRVAELGELVVSQGAALFALEKLRKAAA